MKEEYKMKVTTTAPLTNATRNSLGMPNVAFKDQSIHPRVVNGRTVHPKVNTAKAKKS